MPTIPKNLNTLSNNCTYIMNTEKDYSDLEVEEVYQGVDGPDDDEDPYGKCACGPGEVVQG